MALENDGMLSFDDMFNFGDETGQKKIIQILEGIDRAYAQMAISIRKNNEAISEEMGKMKVEAEAARKALTGKDTKGLLDSNSQVDALFRQNEKLKKSYAEQQEALKKLQEETEKLKKSRADLPSKFDAEGKSLAELKKQLKEAENAYAALGEETDKDGNKRDANLKQIRELGEAIDKQNKVIRDAKKGIEVTAGSYNELSREVNALNHDLRQLGDREGKNAEESKRLEKIIHAKTQTLKEWDAAVNQNFRNVGNYKSALDGMGDVFSKIQMPQTGGVTGAIGNIGGIAEGISGVAGGVPYLAAAAGAVTAVSAAFVGLEAALTETNKNYQKTIALTGRVGSVAVDAAAGVGAIAKTFDKDFDEVLRAYNAAMKGFGTSSEETFELISLGLAKGIDLNDDFLDQLREYSPLLGEAGVTFEEMIAIQAKAAQDGIFSDKAVDTIKEGTIKLREMTKATSDALAPLGKLRVEQINNELAAGRTFKAIQLVSDGLNEVSLTAQQTGTIIADVFGGPGEDAGLPWILELRDINAELGEGVLKTNEYQKLLLDIARAQRETDRTAIMLSKSFEGINESLTLFTTNIKTKVLRDLNDLVTAFGDTSLSLSKFKEEIKNVNDAGALKEELKLLNEELATLKEETGSIKGFFTGNKAFYNGLRDIFQLRGLGVTTSEQMFAILEKIQATQKALDSIETGKSGGEFDALSLSLGTTANRIDELRRAVFDYQKTLSQGKINSLDTQAADEKKNIAERIDLYRQAAEERRKMAELEKNYALKEVYAEARERKAEFEKLKEEDVATTQAAIDRINSDTVKGEAAKNKAIIQAKEELALKTAEVNKAIGIEDAIASEKKKKILEDLEQKLLDIQKNLDIKINIQFEMPNAIKPAEDARFDSSDANKTAEFRYKQELIALNEARAAGLITEKVFYDEVEKLSDNLLLTQIDNLESELGYNIQIQDMKLAYASKMAERQTAKEREEMQKRLAIAQAGLTAVSDISNGYADLERAKSEERIRIIEDERDRELEEVALNEEGKARLKEVYDAKIRKEQLAQAKRDKQMRKFQATISMLQGIAGALSQVGTLGPFAFALAAAVGAAGALQIAAIEKTPLPKYAKGRRGGPAEWAIVDDGPGAEVIESGGKKYLGYGEGPRIVHLKAGDKVHPHHSPITQEAIKAMQEGGRAQREIEYYGGWQQKLESARPQPMTMHNMQQVVRMEVGQELGKVVNAINQKPVPNIEIDDQGSARQYEMIGRRKLYHNRFFRRG